MSQKLRLLTIVLVAACAPAASAVTLAAHGEPTGPVLLAPYQPAIERLPPVDSPAPEELRIERLPRAEPAAPETESVAVPGPEPELLPVHPLTPAIELARSSWQAAQGLRDYRCLFVKREHVGGKLSEAESFTLAVRREPLSLYVQCLGPALPRGREILYVAGANRERALMQDTSVKARFVGAQLLDLKEPRLLAGNRHPWSEYGIHALAENLASVYQYESNYGECDVQLTRDVKVDEHDCICVRVTHPVPRRNFRFHITRAYFDARTLLPLRWEAYTWPQRPKEPPVLLEEHAYRKLDLNVGLSDADFDRRNPAYKFKWHACRRARNPARQRAAVFM